MKTKSVFTYLTIFMIAGIISGNLFAQTESITKVNEKLKELKGDVTKIVIQTEEGEKVFEGEEAKLLFGKLKKNRKMMKIEKFTGPKMNVWIDDKDSSKLLEEIIEIDSDPSVFFFDDDDSIHKIMIESSEGIDSLEKEIKVEENDGKLNVTITTIKDDDKKTETFEGDEAKEKLKEMKKVRVKKIGDKNTFLIKKKHGNKFKWIDDDDHVIFLDQDVDSDSITIKINVEKEDGDLKVIVEEKNGDSTKVTEYEGAEAKDFLENNGDENIFIQKLEGDDIKMVISKAKGDKADTFTWIEKEVDELATKIVKYTEDDGKKILTITTVDEDGENKIETFEGEEAEAKFKELKKEMDLHEIESSDSKFIIKKKK